MFLEPRLGPTLNYSHRKSSPPIAYSNTSGHRGHWCDNDWSLGKPSWMKNGHKVRFQAGVPYPEAALTWWKTTEGSLCTWSFKGLIQRASLNWILLLPEAKEDLGEPIREGRVLSDWEPWEPWRNQIVPKAQRELKPWKGPQQKLLPKVHSHHSNYDGCRRKRRN